MERKALTLGPSVYSLGPHKGEGEPPPLGALTVLARRTHWADVKHHPEHMQHLLAVTEAGVTILLSLSSCPHALHVPATA